MELKQIANGEIVDLWSYGNPDQCPADFQEISFQKGLENYKQYMHAAHGMIYSRSDELLWGKYKRHANILMQMRSDGNIGFGGGLLDADVTESVVCCLNREFYEEFNLDTKKCSFVQEDHIMTHVNDKKKFVAHFYAHEVSNEIFYEIEKGAIHAKDWGTETFGILRVPLFVVETDKLRGLPVFLANSFSGCAREQLIETIKRRNLMPCEDLQFAFKRFKDYSSMQMLCYNIKQ